jgi:hypothetical protein
MAHNLDGEPVASAPVRVAPSGSSAAREHRALAAQQRAVELEVFDACDVGDLPGLRRLYYLQSSAGARKAAASRDPSQGITPLHAAAAHGHLHIVEALVMEFGAEPAWFDASNCCEMAVHYAARNGRELWTDGYCSPRHRISPVTRAQNAFDDMASTIRGWYGLMHGARHVIGCH